LIITAYSVRPDHRRPKSLAAEKRMTASSELLAGALSRQGWQSCASGHTGKENGDRQRSSLLALGLSTATCSLAQDVPRHSSPPAAATPEKVSFTEVSAVDVPALPADSIGPPLLCDPDGTILLRLATPAAGVEDPVSISKDGKTVIRFGREKINDIPRSSFLHMFVNGSDVYILARGSIPPGDQDKLRTKHGEIVSPATRSRWFIK
jgi:hypothetical protein